MNFLGIGPLELLLIIVVAIILLGPQKMMETARSAGKIFTEFRSKTEEAKNAINEALDNNEQATPSVSDSKKPDERTAPLQSSKPQNPMTH